MFSNDGTKCLDYAEIDSVKRKKLCAWDYQFHKFNGHGWEYSVYSPQGILSTMTDDEFNSWVDTIPELERIALEGVTAFIEDAKLQESLKEGKLKAENQNEMDDSVIITQLTNEVKEKISNTEIKSLRYKKIFDNVLQELDKIKFE